MISAPAETKYRAEPLRNGSGASILNQWTAFSTAITGTGELYSCMPRVSQGTDDHQRIGNRLTPKSCRVKLDMVIGTWDDNSSFDLTVHVFFLTCPQVRAWANYTAIPITTMLNNGDGTNVSFDGTVLHGQHPINNAEFKVIKHKTFRMVKGFGKAMSTTSASAGATDAVIAPSAQYWRLNQKIPLPKALKYETAGQEYPTNAAPFMCIGFTRNNEDPRGVSNHFIYAQGQTQMLYKDE